MFSILILVFALFVVCPIIAITLPNGFTFDEKLYFKIEPRANYELERCETQYTGCSTDCSTSFFCSNGDYIIDPINTLQCDLYLPYCVKNSRPYGECSANFPMNNQACLTKALNNFICTEDGQFPDPTDCSKYHICNGSVHSIVECPASHHYTYDLNNKDPNSNPGNGEFKCRFRDVYESSSCDPFYGSENDFIFRVNDWFHYGYWVVIGTLRKTLMFKCPPGTRHHSYANTSGSVDCVPLAAPIG